MYKFDDFFEGINAYFITMNAAYKHHEQRGMQTNQYIL
jgi:hypothetical protein